ncbi:MAG TPA: mechanosensitive ion channel family protein [Actinomycetota bacterium]|nr:mechanosensitive ion channel family protein [Actinomycetota bacterium]
MSLLACHPCADVQDWLLSHGVRIGVILLVAFGVLALARLAVRRMQRRLEGTDGATQELNLQRTATLTQAMSYVVRVLVWTVTLLLLLGEFDIQLGPLLAGAGIAGVALGFGAQSVVRDLLSGFFILLENQYGVSERVTVLAGSKEVSGKVETLSLRTTELRDFDGTLHIIPNGNIIVVGNHSRGWARAIVDVQVAYTEDLHRVRGVLDELFGELRQDTDLARAFFSGPEVLGVEGVVGEKDVTLRVTAEVRPTRRGDLERLLRQRIKERFDERGVSVPASAQAGGDGGGPT